MRKFMIVCGLLAAAGITQATSVGVNTGYWDDPSSWSPAVLPPVTEKINIAANKTITLTNTATIAIVALGDNSNQGTLVIDGGELISTTTSWSAVGYNAPCSLLITGNGSWTSSGRIDIGLFDKFDGAARLEIDSGELNVGGALRLGESFDGVEGVTPVSMSASASISGGTVTASSLSIGSLNSVMDLSGGTVIIDGNITGDVTTWIAGGQMTAYGGSGTVSASYNVSSDQTTIIGIASLSAPLPAELELRPPSGRHVTMYSLSGWTALESRLDEEWEEFPLYTPYSNTDPDWWDNLLAEQLQARLPVIMLAVRPAGSMLPKDLYRAAEAFERNDIDPDLMKIANFIDTAGWETAYNKIYGTNVFDFSNTDAWDTIVWQSLIKPWFATIPSNYWYCVEDKPVVHIWNIDSGSLNTYGNLSLMTTWLCDQFEAEYHVRPWVMHMKRTANLGDSTLYGNPDVLGLDPWFDADGYEVFDHNGFKHVTGCPAYQELNPAFEGSDKRVYRQDGATMLAALNAARDQNADQMLLEGWTNFLESMGLYRSEEANWLFPNQYINMLREFTDPATETIRLEAEGCDYYSDTTAGNTPGKFRRSGDLDIEKIDAGPGWVVSHTAPGEWIEHKDVYFSAGDYRISVKYASPDSQTLRIKVDGVSLGDVPVPSTAGWDAYDYLDLGDVSLAQGVHTIRLDFVTGSVNVDWLFVRKIDGPPATTVGLTATAGNNSVGLDWADNGDSDLAGYTVYRSTVSGSYGGPVATGLTGSSFVDHGVVNGTTYYYVVTAVDVDGNESGIGREVSVLPVIPPLMIVDDFNDSEGLDYSGWTEVGGVNLYVEQDGRLIWNLGANEIDHVTLNNTVLNTKELDIQVDVSSFDGAGTFYIYFLYQDANNWYRLNVNDDISSVFQKRVGGNISNVGLSGEGRDGGRWQVVVDPAAGRLQFISDDEEILNVSETIAFAGGQVGLGGNNRRPSWDNFSVTGIIDGTYYYTLWANSYGLSGEDAAWTNDYDRDGLNNLYEYGLGGNPTNGTQTPATLPTLVFAGSGFEYIHPMRSDDASLTYTVETSTNLLSNVWTNSGYSVLGTHVTGGVYDEVTNSIPAQRQQLFIRLKVEGNK